MTAPLGLQGCERLADAAFATAHGVALEVVVRRDAEGLTRFANSQIHQNVWRDVVEARVRAVTADGRVGVAVVHSDDPADVRAAAQDAVELARVAPPDDEFPGLAPAAAAPAVLYDERTAVATPADRAAAVRGVLGEVPDELEAAGAYRTSGRELAVFTTAGQRVYAPMSAAALTLVVGGVSSSGYAEGGGRTMDDIDPAAAGRSAVSKATAGADPVEIEAGAWPVILEPPAVATLTQWLAYLGFGGRDWLEGRAFTAGRLGQRVVDERLTVIDDALTPDMVGQPFDEEGTPKQRVELVCDGVATAVVHDRHSAARAGTTSTGHALPAPNPHGPMAVNPLLLPGDGGTLDDLIAGSDRAILVTRFHYTNVIDPKQTLLTGMTRDGTFLVEGGRVTAPLRNLRFTQSVLGALNAVEAISTQTSYATELYSEGGCFPAVRLGAFHFTGATGRG